MSQIVIPKMSELFEDNMDVALQNEPLNLLLNQQPRPEWVKIHPYIMGYRYLPIDKVEFLLRKIFKKYSIEITGQGVAFNGVWVTVRVHYYNPTTGEMNFHDGIGAAQLQTKGGASPADLININNGALSMAFPIAKTVAIKDACDHFGNLFGANLNRKDVIEYTPDQDFMQTIGVGEVSYLEQLIRSSTFDHDKQSQMESELFDLTKAEAEKMKKILLSNQQDRMNEIGGGNQTMIKHKLSEIE